MNILIVRLTLELQTLRRFQCLEKSKFTGSAYQDIWIVCWYYMLFFHIYVHFAPLKHWHLIEVYNLDVGRICIPLLVQLYSMSIILTFERKEWNWNDKNLTFFLTKSTKAIQLFIITLRFHSFAWILFKLKQDISLNHLSKIMS